MALSTLLRGALNVCRSQPSFLASVPIRNYAAASVIIPRQLFLQRTADQKPLILTPRVPPSAVICPPLLEAARQFRTTSVVCSSHGDHRKLWTLEKALAVLVMVLIPASLAVPNPILEAATAISIVMHAHWGLEAIAMDYMRPVVVGHTIAKFSIITVYALSIFVLAGLFNLIFNNIGLANSVKAFWSI